MEHHIIEKKKSIPRLSKEVLLIEIYTGVLFVIIIQHNTTPTATLSYKRKNRKYFRLHKP